MSKELEALERMIKYKYEEFGVERDDGTDFDKDYIIIEKGLQRLEAYDKMLTSMYELYKQENIHPEDDGTKEMREHIKKEVFHNNEDDWQLFQIIIRLWALYSIEEGNNKNGK